VRSILLWPNERLIKPCAPVPVVDDGVRALAADLLETLYAYGGRGLAASQIGELRRVFVMDADWKQGKSAPVVFINPISRHAGGELVRGAEQCLSIPSVTAQVTRPAQISMSWVGLDGETMSGKFDGFEARCIQHEMDHLDGIVTLLRIDPGQRAKLEAEYLA
jgi:peptide deformylase